MSFGRSRVVEDSVRGCYKKPTADVPITIESREHRHEPRSHGGQAPHDRRRMRIDAQALVVLARPYEAAPRQGDGRPEAPAAPARRCVLVDGVGAGAHRTSTYGIIRPRMGAEDRLDQTWATVVDVVSNAPAETTETTG